MGVRSRRVLALALLAATAGCRATAPADAPPIAWREFTSETFEDAARQDRLVLVNVAAAWCHWCHVMDAETLADPEVRAIVAERYVAVRADADARPDVAERYRRWGWPATAVLTPDGRPVLERRGFVEPGPFAALLREAAEAYRAGRPVARDPEPPRDGAPDTDLRAAFDRVLAQLDGFRDADAGGWGRPQKYPLPAPLLLDLVLAHGGRAPERGAHVLRTLGGHAALLDPVFGGMYQYSLRGDWVHPHYEKIVPVQADAIDAFVAGYGTTGDAAMLARARRVADYVRRFLTAKDGAFLTSQDADLGTPGHAAEGTSHVLGEDYYALGEPARLALGVPWVDRNVYSDRNGLLVQAWCALHDADPDPAVLAEAVTAARRVQRTHGTQGGLFLHAEGDDPALLHLSDQVEMGRAMVALAASTGDRAWLAEADALADAVLAAFSDTAGGALRAHTVPPGAAGPLARPRTPFRENARAARWLLDLHELRRTYAEDRLRAAAERILRALAAPGTVRPEGRMTGDFALALHALLEPKVHVQVAGPAGDPRTARLLAVALRTWHPHRLVERLDADRAVPPSIVVCTANACSAPITDPDTAAAQLRALLDVR